MARTEDPIRDQRVREEQVRLAKTKEDVNKRFGPDLGDIFYAYVYKRQDTLKERQEVRLRFARLCDNMITNGDVNDRVNAIAALLEASETLTSRLISKLENKPSWDRTD